MKTQWSIAKPAVGVVLGDSESVICRLDADDEVVDRRTMSTTRANFEFPARQV
jgi:hypothetical protein